MTTAATALAWPELFLNPGETAFREGGVRLSTLLGSCVAITLWHPRRRSGGLCHFLLPSRSRRGAGGLDGRYADEALELLARAAARAGVRLDEFEAGLFGGGNMFPQLSLELGETIGRRNVAAARELAGRHGMRVVAEDLGGAAYRRVVLDLADGAVRVVQADVYPFWTDLARLAGEKDQGPAG